MPSGQGRSFAKSPAEEKPDLLKTTVGTSTAQARRATGEARHKGRPEPHRSAPCLSPLGSPQCTHLRQRPLRPRPTAGSPESWAARARWPPPPVLSLPCLQKTGSLHCRPLPSPVPLPEAPCGKTRASVPSTPAEGLPATTATPPCSQLRAFPRPSCQRQAVSSHPHLAPPLTPGLGDSLLHKGCPWRKPSLGGTGQSGRGYKWMMARLEGWPR